MHAHLIHPHTALSRDLRADRRAVLLADGDPDVHVIYGAVLEHEGFRVLHAFSAAECLRLAATARTCAALVSVGECGLLTWRGLRQLAAAAASGGFAVVCLTTDPRLSPAARRPPCGASAVLMLPCTPELLAAEVCRVIHPGSGQPN